jgi:hypothetical protein
MAFFRSITDYDWRDVVKQGQCTEPAPTTKIYFLLFGWKLEKLCIF